MQKYLLRKLCSCIKKVRDTVKLRTKSTARTKESAAIGICVKSVLQRRGKTIKRFGKNQNQRQYVTQPSTTVPNDQGSFANWLYKIPGKTCKEGGREACLSGTDSGLIPWLTHRS